MPQPGGAGDGRLRASDGDREAVVERLRLAHAEGRLDLTEFDERARCAYAARTYAELDTLTSDLPVRPAAAAGLAAPAPGAAPVTGHRAGLGSRIVGSAWFAASVLNLVIWAVVCIGSGHLVYPWWIWVAGPWGAVLVIRWLRERAGADR